jgi:hypothetical protein
VCIVVAGEVQGRGALLLESGFVDIGILQTDPGIDLESIDRGWEAELQAGIVFGGVKFHKWEMRASRRQPGRRLRRVNMPARVGTRRERLWPESPDIADEPDFWHPERAF